MYSKVCTEATASQLFFSKFILLAKPRSVEALSYKAHFSLACLSWSWLVSNPIAFPFGPTAFANSSSKCPPPQPISSTCCPAFMSKTCKISSLREEPATLAAIFLCIMPISFWNSIYIAPVIFSKPLTISSDYIMNF